jgi:hypothetical protein
LARRSRLRSFSRVEGWLIEISDFAGQKQILIRKSAGKVIEAPEEKADRSNVINLMDALRKSMKNKRKGVAAHRTSSRRRKTNKRRLRPRSKRKAA